MINVVAVGEPIELSLLRTITDSAAVEEADRFFSSSRRRCRGSGSHIRSTGKCVGRERRRPPQATSWPDRLRSSPPPEHRRQIRIVVRRRTTSSGLRSGTHVDCCDTSSGGCVDSTASGRSTSRSRYQSGRRGAEASMIPRSCSRGWANGLEAESVLAKVDTGKLTDTQGAADVPSRGEPESACTPHSQGSIDHTSASTSPPQMLPHRRFPVRVLGAIGLSGGGTCSPTASPHPSSGSPPGTTDSVGDHRGLRRSRRSIRAATAAESRYPLPVRPSSSSPTITRTPCSWRVSFQGRGYRRT